jgi:phage-related protein
MIPILFAADETQFNNFGLGALVDCISCTVTEIRDTWEFECEFQYPVNGRLYNKIKIGCIVYVDHDATKKPQPFDIYAYETSIDGITTFHAHHVSYRLSKWILTPCSGTIDGQTVWTWTGRHELLHIFGKDTNSYNGMHFNEVSASDAFTTGMSYLCDYGFTEALLQWEIDKPKTVREYMLGAEGSMFDRYHCEFIFDRFKIYAYKPPAQATWTGIERGFDRPITIRYDYNLTGLQYEFDTSNTTPALIPYWVDPETQAPFYLSGNESFVDEGGIYFDADTVATNGGAMGGTFDATPIDLSDEFDSRPTALQLLNAAIEYANTHAITKPHENLSIDFECLRDFHEYENYVDAQELLLCDTCTVVFPQLNLYKRMKVVKTVYDPLADGYAGRYTKLELGSSSRGIFTVNATANTEQIDPDVTFIDYDGEIQEEIDNGDGNIWVVIDEEDGSSQAPDDDLPTDTEPDEDLPTDSEP